MSRKVIPHFYSFVVSGYKYTFNINLISSIIQSDGYVVIVMNGEIGENNSVSFRKNAFLNEWDYIKNNMEKIIELGQK